MIAQGSYTINGQFKPFTLQVPDTYQGDGYNSWDYHRAMQLVQEYISRAEGWGGLHITAFSVEFKPA